MARNTKKDQEMAADLKARGVKRTTMRCPICNAEIPVAKSYEHIGYHPG